MDIFSGDINPLSASFALIETSTGFYMRAILALNGLIYQCASNTKFVDRWNEWFQDDFVICKCITFFREYRKRPVASNGLIKLFKFTFSLFQISSSWLTSWYLFFRWHLQERWILPKRLIVSNNMYCRVLL